MKSSGDLEARVRELEDHEAIRQVIYHQIRGTDRCDFSEHQRTLWPDIEYYKEGPSSTGGGNHPHAQLLANPTQGGASRIEIARRMYAGTFHHIGNILIELRGDEAFTETYSVAYHQTQPDGSTNADVVGEDHIRHLGLSPDKACTLVIAFRYIDRFERRGDVWKIARRRRIFDWHATIPHPGEEPGGLYKLFSLRGDRVPADASYEEESLGALAD
jgi:hypothetical protein